MRIKALINRNLKEMYRDPLIYIFCIGFPIIMILLFTVINKYTSGTTPTFSCESLIPGVLVFAYTFTMLLMSLLVSKDRTTSLLKRLYISPCKPIEYILSYATVGLILVLCQSIICVLFGYIISLIISTSYMSFVSCILLILSQMPIAIMLIFLGILFGSKFNQNSAPGLSSIFISAAGILGGCWMPLETMGNFAKACEFLPFYPSVLIGRAITSATDAFGNVITFSTHSIINIIVIAIYLILSVTLSNLVFKSQMTKD